MMAGGAAVVVEVNAVADRGRDEPQHRRAVVANGVAIVRDFVADAEINPEPGPQTLDSAGDAMPGQDFVESGEQARSESTDMSIEARFTIGSDSGQSGGDRYRMAVIRAAVLAIPLGHEVRHDIAAAAEHAQGV